jgi:hypothetical protein
MAAAALPRAALLVALGAGLFAAAAAAETAVAGWAERVMIGDAPGLSLRAKLDTGAETASLDAEDLRLYHRDGKPRASFTARNDNGQSARFDLPVVRTVQIRRHGGSAQARPVVRLAICLGRVLREAEVNLIDRTGFDYRMLIGRDFLAGKVVVDPAKVDLLPPNCRDGKAG